MKRRLGGWMKKLITRFLQYWLTFAQLLTAGGALFAAPGPEYPVEEVRKSEPVGANQLLLRAVYQLPSQAHDTATWTPVVSALTSDPIVLDFEIRDNRELGYILRNSLSCAGSGAECQFNWKPVTLDSLHLGPRDLWALARQRSSPIQFRYVPVCLCSTQNVSPSSPIRFVLVPTRPINLSYLIKTEKGETIKSESLENLPAGKPFEISISPAKLKLPTVLKVRLNHVAIQDGEVERLTDSFDVLWGR
jgi:hypothetical protein